MKYPFAIILILCIHSCSFSQIPMLPNTGVSGHWVVPLPPVFVPGAVTTIINTDPKSNALFAKMAGTEVTKAALTIKTTAELDTAIRKMEDLLKDKYHYDKKYDGNKSFLIKSQLLLTMTLIIRFIVTSNIYTRRYGITAAKSDFLLDTQNINYILLALQRLDNTKIDVGQRQAIYREEKKLLNDLAKTILKQKKILMIPAVKFIILNDDQLFRVLSAFTIFADVASNLVKVVDKQILNNPLFDKIDYDKYRNLKNVLYHGESLIKPIELLRGDKKKR